MDVDVIVAGAGPAGLMLAGELRLGGAEVVLLERLPEPSAESRAPGFTTRTMEVFDQRGILSLFGELTTTPYGHFGGVPLDVARALDGVAFAAQGIPQSRTEEVLARWVTGLGVEVRRGWELTGLADDDEFVEVTVAAPVGNGTTRIILYERGVAPRRRDAAPDFAEIAAAWKRLTGEDISGLTPVWVTASTDAARQVTRYRRGRVLLAGDAAHIHLPTGGQGMNVSIQDSVNLGWKLAATVRGWAPPGLLDIYHEERHPVGARLLLNTQAQGLLVLGGEAMQPLREILTELVRYPEVERHLAGLATALEVRYDVGPSDHPLLGLRMPDRPLVTAEGETGTARLLRGARGVLLDLADPPELRRAATGWDDRVDVVTAKSPEDGPGAVLIRPDGHVARLFTRFDETEMPGLMGTRRRQLFSFHGLYFHLQDFDGNGAEAVEKARSHPLFTKISEDLRPYIGAYDPETWRSPADAMAHRF
jgi:bifunctional hydroxylase/dehydrase